jgi:TetR/AcrR family transcriptional repressor of nem operon
MPRPSRRHQFLDSARKLVQQRGFASTSVDAVCEEAGATKGAFFHYFRDKDELGVALLQYFRDSGRAALGSATHGHEQDPRRRLRRYLEHLEAVYTADPRFRDGCLYAIFAYENADPRSEVRRMCAAAIEEWLDSASSELKAILSESKARPAVRARELAEHLLASVEGALILDRTAGKRGAMRRALAHFRRYVESMMPA